MQNKVKNRFLLGTLALLLVVMLLNRLGNVLASDALVWQLHDLTQSTALVLSTLLVTHLISFKHLKYKCVAAAIFASYLIDGAMVVLAPDSHVITYVFQFAAATLAVLFYANRSYDLPSDVLDNDHFFCIRKRPDTLQDFLISLLGWYGADGSYMIYARGKLYHYKRGLFQVSKVTRQGALSPASYHIIKGCEVTDAKIEELRAWAGSTWSYRHNCLTFLARFWRECVADA